MTQRHEYFLDLTGFDARDPAAASPGLDLRAPRTSDAHALAELMLEGYRGTIDYEGETMIESVAEVRGWREGRAGPPLADVSRLAVAGPRLISACLVSVIPDGAVQPCAGEGRVAFGGGDGNAQQGGAFFEGEAGEVAKLHQFGLAGVVGGEAVQGVMDGEQFVAVFGGGDFETVEIEVILAATVFGALFAARAVHKNAAHGFGGGTEEVRAVFKRSVPQPQPCLVDERGRLERVAGVLAGHFHGSDAAELRVDGGHQFTTGPQIPQPDGLEDLGDIIGFLVFTGHSARILPGSCGRCNGYSIPQGGGILFIFAVEEGGAAQLGVESAMREQLRMSALLDDFAEIEDVDPVRVSHSAQPVRDHE